MRKYVLTAALVAAALPLAPAMAREMNGYTARSTTMWAGPDSDYPAVRRLPRNAGVTVHGCLRNWSWCDVSYRYDRGWIAQRDLNVNYQGRRRGISSSMGLVILSFSFGNYWDSYYRSRPFYAQRPRWEQQYTKTYRPEWGPRPQAPAVAPRPRQLGTDVRQGPRPQGQVVPERRFVPHAPAAVPQQRQPGAVQRQVAPAQRPAAPPRRVVAPNPQAAPGKVGRDQSHAPGKQDGGPNGNRQSRPDAEHKSRN